MTRSEIRDTLNKRDLAASKLGQASAKRYLETRKQPPARGNIRDTLALTIFITVILVIGMAL